MFKISARTVLELGSELISSDIIAFYELVKNAFDAGSKSGADVHFRISLRRNAYLSMRERAIALQRKAEKMSAAELDEGLALLRADLAAQIDESAGKPAGEFLKAIQKPRSLSTFVHALDGAYSTYNTIEISDTGSGMSMPELIRNYLTIGTPSRKREVELALAAGTSKAPYLGEKGIGRLSAMRLGETLLLETARKEDERKSVLEIDWSKFADLDAMVGDISIEPKEGARKDSPSWSGTKITIGNLAEDWTEKRVRELADNEFAGITDPFTDPKARPRIGIHWNGSRISIPWMDRQLTEHAHAKFSGKYTVEPGGPELTARLEAFNLGYKHPREVETIRKSVEDLAGLMPSDVPMSALASIGPFEFEAYWYNRRYLVGIDTIGNQKAVRDLQKKWSGIRVYRDGFRVFPYGEEYDDWLGLDRRALGRTGYVLNKAQFVGRVSIRRSANPKLIDQTNREGLRVTPEQKVFVELLQYVVTDALWLFFKRMDRQYRDQPVQLGDIKADTKSLEARVNTAIAKVRKHVPKEHHDVVNDLQLTLAEFHDLSARAQARIEQVERDSKQMVHMAGVGLMVEVVAHELARATESALHALEGLKAKELPSEVRAKLETLRAEMKSVSKRLRVLDELSVPGRQRFEVFDLGELISDLFEGHAAQLRRHGVELQYKKPTQPVRVKLVKGMVVQIFENLLANSLFWMQARATREPRYVPVIKVHVDIDPPTVHFKDNGPGISPDHHEKVFDAFWSLKEKNKRRGLGLFIARENAKYLDATLTVSKKPDRDSGRLNEFVLELPESSLAK